jgi:hypothetical protein
MYEILNVHGSLTVLKATFRSFPISTRSVFSIRLGGQVQQVVSPKYCCPLPALDVFTTEVRPLYL